MVVFELVYVQLESLLVFVFVFVLLELLLLLLLFVLIVLKQMVVSGLAYVRSMYLFVFL